MDFDNTQLVFFKNKVKNRIDELKPYISDVKYRLYITMIEDCNSVDELREMAELDLQLNLIKYTKEINDKIQRKYGSIQNIEDKSNNLKASPKLSIISSTEKEDKTEGVSSLDILELGEDLENEEILASAAALLAMRLKDAPPEVLYDDEDYEPEYDVTSIDAVDGDELYEEVEGEDTDEEEDDIEFEEDVDEEDDDNFIDEDDIIEDKKEEPEESDDDIIDFGDIKEKDVDKSDITDESEDNDEPEFEEDEEEYNEDEPEFVDDDEPEFEDDDELFADEEDEPEFADDEDDNEDIDDEGLFVDEEEPDFVDDDEPEFEEDDDTESNDEPDFVDEDDMFEDDEPEFADDEPEFEDDEPEFEDDDSAVDDIDTDELFEDDEPEFDIDESEFEEEPEDDLDSFFADTENNKTQKKAPEKRKLTPDSVFINGTARGNSTQQTFNAIIDVFGGASKFFKIAGDFTKKQTQSIKIGAGN